MLRMIIFVVLLIGLALPASAQVPEYLDEQANQQTATGLPTDARSVIGIPTAIPERIEEIDQRHDTLLDTPRIDRALKPWHDFKKDLDQRYGLKLGAFYTSLYQKASNAINMPGMRPGRDEASGGGISILAELDLFGPNSNSPGRINLHASDRHRYGAIYPQDFSGQIGSQWPTAIYYEEVKPFSIIELYWEQFLIKDRLAFRLGRAESFDNQDYARFKDPVSGFLNGLFGLNPTVPWTDPGFNVSGFVRPTKGTYINGGIFDANSKVNRAGWETFFKTGEYLSVVDIGWDPGFIAGSQPVYIGPLKVYDVHATIWHRARLEKRNSPEGWGITAYAEGEVGRFVPFVRYGHSKGTSRGNPAALKKLVTGGIGIKDVFGQNNDLIGIAYGWGKRERPADATGPVRLDQYAGELFYRIQVTQELQVTPGVQVTWDPILNPNESTVTVGQIRGRVDW